MSVRFGWYPTSIWQSPDEVVRYSIIAENSGFASVWHNDHAVLCPSPPSTSKDLTPDVYIVLTMIACNTRKVRVGPGVTDPFRRHPFITAQTVATLDYISGGRAMLGIGAGHQDMVSPFNIKFENPIERLKECITLMKLLWTKKNPSFEGRFYRMFFKRPLYPNLSSAIIQRPHPPIYIGSLSSRKMRELTGEVAQGFFPYLCPPRLYSKWIMDIKTGAERCGRKIDQIDTCAFLNVAFSKNYASARREAERLKESVVGYPHLFGPELGYKSPPAQARYHAHSLSKKVPFELVEELAAIGSSENCIDKIEEYVRAGARHILIRKVTPKRYREFFGMLKTKVIPCFSGRQ